MGYWQRLLGRGRLMGTWEERGGGLDEMCCVVENVVIY